MNLGAPASRRRSFPMETTRQRDAGAPRLKHPKIRTKRSFHLCPSQIFGLVHEKRERSAQINSDSTETRNANSFFSLPNARGSAGCRVWGWPKVPSCRLIIPPTFFFVFGNQTVKIGDSTLMPFLRTLIGHPLERQPDALVRSRVGLPIVAQTLGDAITVAAEFFGVSIVPHDPPQWFRIYGLSESAAGYRLADIRIFRDGKDVFPKQDLSFPLLESDEVRIGMLCD